MTDNAAKDNGPYVCRECGTKIDPYVTLRLTAAERDRVLWWLHQPVPPGPMKELDVAIIRKIQASR